MQMKEKKQDLEKDKTGLGKIFVTIRKVNINVIRVSEGKEKKKGGETMSKTLTAKNVPNPGRKHRYAESRKNINIFQAKTTYTKTYC